MADEEGKILGGMTPEELREYSELAEKIRDNLNQSKSALDDISTREQFRLQNARDYILELENISEITNAITEAEKEKDQIQADVRARGAGAQTTARETAKKLMLDTEIERLKEINQILSSQSEVDKLRNTLQQQRVKMGLQEIQGLQLTKILRGGHRPSPGRGPRP
jgi:inactivated superfamily I helicase